MAKFFFYYFREVMQKLTSASLADSPQPQNVDVNTSSVMQKVVSTIGSEQTAATKCRSEKYKLSVHD